jgi:hypothetical protein
LANPTNANDDPNTRTINQANPVPGRDLPGKLRAADKRRTAMAQLRLNQTAITGAGAPITAPETAADSSADRPATLHMMIRQAAALARAARCQAASLDPGRVRVQDAEAARRRAEAAAVTSDARAAQAAAQARALAESLQAARDDARAAQAAADAARREAEAAAAALEQTRHDAAGQIAAVQAEAAAQVSAAQGEATRTARERDDAIQAARRADAETDRARADAARERDTLGDQHQAQLQAAAALTVAERARAGRAEQMLEAERADRRHLTSAFAAPLSNGNGRLPMFAAAAGVHRPRGFRH